MSRLASTTEIQYISAMEDRFDPAKDAVNQIKHQLSLAVGDRTLEDDDHLMLPCDPRDRRGGAIQGDRFGGEQAVYRRFRLAGRPAPFHFRAKEQHR